MFEKNKINTVDDHGRFNKAVARLVYIVFH